MENIVKQDLSNDKLVVMEITNELIKTLGDMPSQKADEIVCSVKLLEVDLRVPEIIILNLLKNNYDPS